MYGRKVLLVLLQGPREFGFWAMIYLKRLLISPPPSPPSCKSIYLQTKKSKIHIFISTIACFKALSTAISRKVIAKNVHATNPKGNMGYDQYTVYDTEPSNLLLLLSF